MKIKNSLSILKESWNVLKLDSELLWFPVMSGVAMIAVLATIFFSFLLIPMFSDWGAGLLEQLLGADDATVSGFDVLGLLLLFVVYLVEYFVVIYFNTALVSCALLRFEGGDPTLTDGFNAANSRLKQIIGWTLLSAGVGTILSAIEERLGFVGKLVFNLVGAAWAIATYFVVPILAAEGLGPIDSVKRSVTLLKKSWGEGLIGNVSIGLITFLGCLGVMAVGGLLTALGIYINSIFFIFVAVLLAVVALVVVLILNSALHQIFLAGLYRYATTGLAPNGFSEGSMSNALVVKKS